MLLITALGSDGQVPKFAGRDAPHAGAPLIIFTCIFNLNLKFVAVPGLWSCFAAPSESSSVLSGMRVGVRAPPLSLCRSMSVKRRAMDHGGHSPFTGNLNWPNCQALPHSGTRPSLGAALNVLPNAELLAVVTGRQTSAACPKQLSTKRARRRKAKAE